MKKIFLLPIVFAASANIALAQRLEPTQGYIQPSVQPQGGNQSTARPSQGAAPLVGVGQSTKGVGNQTSGYGQQITGYGSSVKGTTPKRPEENK